MKKIFFIIFAVLISLIGTAQTAPNFSCNDCKGTNYDLYSQIDSGKVVVICWVMPCSSCIAPSKTSYNVVQSFQAAHPGKVLFFLCDDYGDTPCTSIDSWANTNGIPASANSLRFSNSVINMTNYGTVGMPKIIAVGGSNHKILYNANGSVSGTALQTAINDALNANGIVETDILTSSINLFPNPVADLLNLSFTLQQSTDVSIEVFDNIGQKVYEKKAKYATGLNKTDINTAKFANGNYFVKISNTDRSRTLQFNVSH
ncbi:MAG: T9SS type A sorting domain-containing protein [Bacteroidales bacterium]